MTNEQRIKRAAECYWSSDLNIHAVARHFGVQPGEIQHYITTNPPNLALCDPKPQQWGRRTG